VKEAKGEAMRRLIDAQQLRVRKAPAKARAVPEAGERRLPINSDALNVRPLNLAEQRARSRWHRPLAAILSGALAENRGLLERLRVGVHGSPDWKNNQEIYQAVFNELWEATKKQVEALEIFSRVKWSD
jgi:hypothetical protein